MEIFKKNSPKRIVDCDHNFWQVGSPETILKIPVKSQFKHWNMSDNEFFERGTSPGAEEDDSKSPSAELTDVLSQTFAPQAHSSLTEILHSSTSLDSTGPPSATCGLITKVFQECDEVCSKLRPRASTSTSLTSGEKAARDIMDLIFRKATKCRLVKKQIKPEMKSGFMHLDRHIPNFNIDDETFDNIAFHEHLLVSFFETPFYPTPVGALTLDIQTARGGPTKSKKIKSDFVYPKFLVHLSSQLDFFGHNGGSRITSWVDRNLQTLEEKRREYIKMEDGLDQQLLYINSQPDFYYLRTNKKNDIVYSQKRAENLICEGSNFVLMRYLAITKFVGTFETTTVYINGDLCRNIYECKGPSGGMVNDQKLDVCKIYRTIIEQCGVEHKSITLMTLSGQIIKQEWRFCNHILQINPLIEVKNEKPSELLKIPLEKYCGDDLQMLSMYLDAKTTNKKLIDNYMLDHPEIKDLLADYVQSILQLKPDDVFEFTARYFLSYTPSLLPLSEYFEPSYDFDEAEDIDFWKYQ